MCRPVATILLCATAGIVGPAQARAQAQAAAPNCPQVPAVPDINSGSPPSSSYLLSSMGDFVGMLPPPPAADSEAQRQDLAGVLAAQRAAPRGSPALERAVADAEATCGRFSDAVGKELQEKAAEKPLAFLNKAAQEVSGAAGSQGKRYWWRQRPYQFSNQVQRFADVVPYYEPPKAKVDPACQGANPSPPAAGPGGPDGPDGPGKDKTKDPVREKAEKEKTEVDKAWSSYPSGHATFGTACAILLAEMVPEKRTEIFARGREYAANRMVVGAHFPSDIESGRLAATAGMALMSLNPTFERDFFAARTQLRTALGLPAEVPELKPAKPAVVEAAEKAEKDAKAAAKQQRREEGGPPQPPTDVQRPRDPDPASAR